MPKKIKPVFNPLEVAVIKGRLKEILEELSLEGDEYYKELTELVKKTAHNLVTNKGQIKRIHRENKEYFIDQAIKSYPHLGDKTPTKKELKKRKNKGETKPLNKSLFLLRQFISLQYNRLYNSRFSFNYSGDIFYAMDVVAGYEHRFIKFDSTPLHDEKTLWRSFKDVFDFQKAWEEDINLDKGIYKTKRFQQAMDPDWVVSDESSIPQMHLVDGGFVNRGTYKKYDCVPALLCRNEFCWTQEATRGIGKGSYMRGAECLYALMLFFEEESKRFPHER